jgi:uncharacterized protein (TIRG00374 family)
MNSGQTPSKVSGLDIKYIIKPLVIIIPLAFAGNIIFVLLASGSSIPVNLKNYNLNYLLAAIALAFMPWPAHAMRVMIWSRAFGRHLSFGDSLKTVVATDVGGAIAPTAIGGSYVKLGLLVRFGFTPGEAALVTLLGTLEDAAFFAIAIPLALAITGAWENPGIKQTAENIITFWPYILAVILGLLSIYVFLLKFGMRKNGGRISFGQASSKGGFLWRLRDKLKVYKSQFADAFEFVKRNHKGTFMLCVFSAGISWICRYSVITLLILGLGLQADPILFFLLQWVVFTLMTAFPTPGAVGGAEISFALIYKGVVPDSAIPIAITAWRFLTFYLLMIVGSSIVVFTGLGKPRRPNEKAANTEIERTFSL